jgi:hypothetical protein
MLLRIIVPRVSESRQALPLGGVCRGTKAYSEEEQYE